MLACCVKSGTGRTVALFASGLPSTLYVTLLRVRCLCRVWVKYIDLVSLTRRVCQTPCKCVDCDFVAYFIHGFLVEYTDLVTLTHCVYQAPCRYSGVYSLYRICQLLGTSTVSLLVNCWERVCSLYLPVVCVWQHFSPRLPCCPARKTRGSQSLL